MEDLTRRYNTLLELMGEKEEQVEELKADILDMKALYRNQINELLERIEHLSNPTSQPHLASTSQRQ
jgi:hypothetical protein